MTRPLDILIADTYEPAAVDRLRRVGEVRFVSDPQPQTLIREVAGADALLVRTYAQITAAVIDAGRNLKVVGRAGVGLENIDLAAARQRGLPVVYTPAAASDTVAEFTVGLILALERQLATGDALVRADRFREARGVLLGRELRGLTLGIIGLGRIGRRVGRIAQCGLGMNVLFNDLLEFTDLDYSATPADKDRLWAKADVITLHVPLTDLTRHVVNNDALTRVKPTATLVNTSRGPVVDPAAVARALHEKRLAGAALDVHEPEPPPSDHPLRNAPNVLLTPHIAARTHTGLARMNDVVDDVIAVLAGRPPQYPAPHE